MVMEGTVQTPEQAAVSLLSAMDALHYRRHQPLDLKESAKEDGFEGTVYSCDCFKDAMDGGWYDYGETDAICFNFTRPILITGAALPCVEEVASTKSLCTSSRVTPLMSATRATLSRLALENSTNPRNLRTL